MTNPSEARILIDGVPTAIQAIDGRTSDAAVPHYDLNGRQTKSPRAGIYVEKGKKVLVK